MLSKTLTVNNFKKVMGSNLLLMFFTPYILVVVDNDYYWPRLFSVVGGCFVGGVIVFSAIITTRPGTSINRVLRSLLAYPLCIFCSLFIAFAPPTSIIFSTHDAEQQRVGTGVTWVGLWDRVEDYRIGRNVTGKSLSVAVHIDSEKILDVHREYGSRASYEKAIQEKVVPLLDVNMPTIDTNISMSCRICMGDSTVRAVKQHIRDLYITGLIVQDNDIYYNNIY